ncbi:CLUMA_CG002909, isoform A [Clunio marinus]|uniref:CLUMA_CG002909, isoform A n=1 Tax=Clunio marinus TaxID=568069 RepID=A0A1J1HP24_9DIPT|nr:CLUMA_CG002909, isoform A [Clunio marinus]
MFSFAKLTSNLLFSKLYRRQLIAMIPAYLTMISGGMFLSYGIFQIFFGYQSFTADMSTIQMFFLPASFHISLMLGALATSFSYYCVEIKQIHLINSLLMLTGSIVLTILPDLYTSVVISRTIFGLGFGSSYITFIIYASEISSGKVRAQIIFLLHLSLTMGMLMLSIFCLGTNFIVIMRVKGSFCIVLTLVSIGLGYFKLKSSHIHMMQNNSKDAFERFLYFQQDNIENPHFESEAMLSYIIEEKKRRYEFFSQHNINTLAIVLLFKIGYLSIFNALHNVQRIVLMSAFLTISDTNFSQLIMMASRMLGCVVGFLFLDNLTKRLQFFISAIIIFLLLLIFSILLSIYQSMSIWTPLIFFIPLEFFVGFGLSPIGDILKGELFPLKEKPVSIATTIIFEEVVHILCIILLLSWISYLGSVPTFMSFIFAFITLVSGFGVVVLLRDSRKQSLRLVANLYSDKRTLN